MLLLLLGCLGEDAPPERWPEVVALAALDGCTPAPAALTGLTDDSDPATIRDAVLAWHRADPGPTRFDSSSTWRVYTALQQHDGSDEFVRASARFAASLGRCGALVDAAVALAITLTACDPRSALYVQAFEAYGSLPDPRGVAAREALSVFELANRDGFSRRHVYDLQHWLTEWVLSDDLAPPEVVTTPLRPLVSMVSIGHAPMWSDLLESRALAERCLAVEPSAVMVQDRTTQLVFPEDAVRAVPELARWLAEHPGVHAVPGELDGPEVRGRLAATQCGQAVTVGKGTLTLDTLRWVPPEQLGYDRAIREALDIPERPAWVLDLGPDAAAPLLVLSTDVPPAPIDGCRQTGRAWVLQPNLVRTDVERVGTLAAPVEELLSLLDVTGGVAPEVQRRLEALPPGFHDALPEVEPLWASGLASGRVRLLSPEGTVTRFAAREGWWTTPDGQRVWPEQRGTVGVLWFDGAAVRAIFDGEPPEGPLRVYTDAGPSSAGGLAELVPPLPTGEGPGAVGYVIGGRGFVASLPDPRPDVISIFDPDEDGALEAFVVTRDGRPVLVTARGERSL